MMVDEVQDLPHAILLLLMKVTEQGLFFSGDTAQTIAKGVGFRFCDMHRLFDPNFLPDVTHSRPVVKQLTVRKILNFSHSSSFPLYFK
jgi:hypothetical protein